MRRRLGILIAGAAIAVTAMVYAADTGTPKGEEGTIVGHVIDVTDYAMFGRLGPEHTASGTHRSEHGFPIAVLEEETGTVWIAVYRLPVPAAGIQTANHILGPFMGKTVAVQGLLFRAKGINVIRVAVVHEY